MWTDWICLWNYPLWYPVAEEEGGGEGEGEGEGGGEGGGGQGRGYLSAEVPHCLALEVSYLYQPRKMVRVFFPAVWSMC